MAKCSLCGKKIEITFLGKIKGTFYKGKPVCPECQKTELNKKVEIPK